MAVPPADPAENWDEDFEFQQRVSCTNPVTDSYRPDATTPLSKDRKNTLKRWKEPGPSTPSKYPAEQPENWDDDFRDSTDSPMRAHQSHQLQRTVTEEPENWDDDFEGTSPKGKAPVRHTSWGSSDEEDDYGLHDKEEDRTVTSRNRGMSLNLHNDSPPPPVPPLPPFPRSPNPSVFSMPASSTAGHESVAGMPYSSTAHLALRSTISSSGSALALLPPSPPIHRERRRLRKKSRPPPAMAPDIFELDDRTDEQSQALLQAPSTPERRNSSLDDPPPLSIAPVATPSSSTRTPLLSRIGSVGKKWGAARKKRASTGPSEIALQEHPSEKTHENERASRPQSVVGDATSRAVSPVSKGGWFFRSGGGDGPGPPDQAGLRHETSMDRLLALARIERGPDSPHRKKSRKSLIASDLPNAQTTVADGTALSNSALFLGGPRRPMSVQMQVSSSHSSSGSSWNSSRPTGRHASYGHDLARRPGTSSSRASSKQRSASASVEDVGRLGDKNGTIKEGERQLRRHGRHVTEVEEKSKEKEGSRSIMGGMRRISLGGSTKHKRKKSTVPVEERKPVAALLARAETPQEETTPRPPSRVIRTSQDGLLPPIELQPPSPPLTTRRMPLPSNTIESGLSLHSRPTLEPSRSHPALSSQSNTPTNPRPSVSSMESHLPSLSPLPSPTRLKTSTSPQVASLGRATQPPKDREGASSSAPPRRNSLGDLKIPARISQAQVGLRRDLGMVREFATSVDQLKQLQQTYHTLVGEIHSIITTERAQSPSVLGRALTPTHMHVPKPLSRSRSNTNPSPSQPSPSPHDFALAFHTIESRYQLSWECAELLVDLGSGASVAPASAPVSPPPTASPAVITPAAGASDVRKGRERAVTLAGDEPKPLIVPSSSDAAGTPYMSNAAQWRASTGRHDLSSRQLLLLREMLNNPDPSVTMSLDHQLPIPEEDWSATGVNRAWRWGDAMSSTVTLPSEDSTQASGSGQSGALKKQKRRSSRLGMRGLRDMLKSLKKTYSEEAPAVPSLAAIPASTSTLSTGTGSSLNNSPSEHHPQVQSMVQRRRAKTSTGPESVKSTRDGERHPNSPYSMSLSLTHRSSPRRPSLASIFRIGQKSKSAQSSSDPSSGDLKPPTASSSSIGRASGGAYTEEEEDWDRLESVEDLEQAARALGLSADGSATVRGKKGKSPYLSHQQGTPRRSPNASCSSVWSVESPRHAAAAAQSLLVSPTSRLRHLADKSAARRTAKERGVSPKRPSSRGRNAGPSGSVRSAPPKPLAGHSPDLAATTLPETKLAMTPENIRPLLENAREVHVRCSECVVELQALLATFPRPATEP